MPFIKYTCKACGKNVELVSAFKIDARSIRKLSCGHSEITTEILESNTLSVDSIKSVDNRTLYAFQKTGVLAAEKSNLNFLFEDEMGLGKTVQILACLALHRHEALPALIVCKSSLKNQWYSEIARWFGPRTFQLTIDSTKSLIPPNLPFYIISFDLLRRFAKKKKIRNLANELVEVEDWEALQALVTRLNIKTLVLDEVQHIKNHQSTRSVAVRKIAELCKYKLGASGTPIKNHAGEYFPILNIIAPELAPSYQGFINQYCDSYWTGYAYKVGGLKDYDEFQKVFGKHLIRRRLEDVDLDFPEVNRTYQYYELGEQVAKAYAATLKEFAEYSETNSDSNFERMQKTLAYLAKMRHLTGLSKIESCTDYIEDFLISTDRKIVIFTHHIDVADLLQIKLNELIKSINEMFEKNISPCYRMHGGEAEKTFDIGEQFQNDKKSRILIAPILSSGEGLNLQRECGDCILLEREWNPPNEEQAVKGRFTRIGSKYKTTNIVYMIAVGTVDKDLTDIVESKRSVIDNTLDGEDYNWQESEIIKELAARTLARYRR